MKRFTLKDIRNAVPGSRIGPPMTVREIARLANISPGHLSNIENGSDPASPRLLWRLAMAYPVPYEAIVAAYEETRRTVAQRSIPPPAKPIRGRPADHRKERRGRK